mmetsp:Transcript_16568/g.53952  ORF Transcript_16568/g.53952 Transcript_16568/m.53952 type:complete len:449 (-) Transcript_16568:849-2195(-)
MSVSVRTFGGGCTVECGGRGARRRWMGAVVCLRVFRRCGIGEAKAGFGSNFVAEERESPAFFFSFLSFARTSGHRDIGTRPSRQRWRSSAFCLRSWRRSLSSRWKRSRTARRKRAAERRSLGPQVSSSAQASANSRRASKRRASWWWSLRSSLRRRARALRARRSRRRGRSSWAPARRARRSQSLAVASPGTAGASRRRRSANWSRRDAARAALNLRASVSGKAATDASRTATWSTTAASWSRNESTGRRDLARRSRSLERPRNTTAGRSPRADATRVAFSQSRQSSPRIFRAASRAARAGLSSRSWICTAARFAHESASSGSCAAARENARAAARHRASGECWVAPNTRFAVALFGEEEGGSGGGEEEAVVVVVVVGLDVIIEAASTARRISAMPRSNQVAGAKGATCRARSSQGMASRHCFFLAKRRPRDRAARAHRSLEEAQAVS